MTQQNNSAARGFEFQPSLESELLSIRALTPNDFDALYQVASDPLIWEQHPVSNRYTEKEFKLFFDEAIESGGALIVFDRASGSAIGSSRYFGFDPEKKDVEIGWSFLARKYWGGRYNGELKRLMLEHAFQFVETVNFMIGPENIRSQKAVEKIGGIRDKDLDAKGRLVFRVSATKTNFSQNF